MRKTILLLIVTVMCLSLLSAADVVIGDFEGDLDGWSSRKASTLTADTLGATTGSGSMKLDFVEGPPPNDWGERASVAILADQDALDLIVQPDSRILMDISARGDDIPGPWINVGIIVNCGTAPYYWALQNQYTGGVLEVTIGPGSTFATETYEVILQEDARAALATADLYAEIQIHINSQSLTGPGKIYVDNVRISLGEDESVPFNPSPEDDNNTPIDPDPVLSWNTALDPATDRPYLNIRKHYVFGSFNSINPTDPNVFYIGEVDAPTVGGGDPNIVETAQYPETGTLSLDYERTYYWQIIEGVDNGLGGVYPPSDPNNIKGPVWEFLVRPQYIAPELEFPNVITTTALADPGPVNIAATVTHSNPITSAAVTLLTDDVQFPTGAVYTFTDTTIDNANPTATLVTDTAGIYFVKAVATDDTGTPEGTDEAIAEVVVYADACQAKKDSPSGWTANYYDRDEDCDVDVADFAELALQWLDDSSMQAQEEEVGPVSYVPQTVFDARIEGESVDPNDVSDAPLTDEVGIRIGTDPAATGNGQTLSYSDMDAFAEYEITVNASVYDVWISTAGENGNAILDFGNGTTADLYGSVGPFISDGWSAYNVEQFVGALDFTTVGAGTYTLRITWPVSGVNLDWFTLVEQP